MLCLVAVVMDVLVVVHMLVVVYVLASVLVFLCVGVVVSVPVLVPMLMVMYVVVSPSLPLLSLMFLPAQESSLHQGEQQQQGEREGRRPVHSHPATAP